jgi:RimJ/RimL family protein N-acetyltransferase
MRTKKVFSHGRILDAKLYDRVQIMDTNIFFGCNNEFKPNREWWVLLNERNQIIAYCGSIYSEGICIYIRAWVRKDYRGKGVQKKLINIRYKAALKSCHTVITYTTKDNYPSVNNLISQ